MPTWGTLTCLAFFLTAMILAGLWLLAIDRQALRPVLTTAVLVVALAGYAAAWIAVS